MDGKDVQIICSTDIEVVQDGRRDGVSASIHARDRNTMTHLCRPTNLSNHPYGSARRRCRHGRLEESGTTQGNVKLEVMGGQQTSANNSPNQETSHR